MGNVRASGSCAHTHTEVKRAFAYQTIHSAQMAAVDSKVIAEVEKQGEEEYEDLKVPVADPTSVLPLRKSYRLTVFGYMIDSETSVAESLHALLPDHVPLAKDKEERKESQLAAAPKFQRSRSFSEVWEDRLLEKMNSL